MRVRWLAVLLSVFRPTWLVAAAATIVVGACVLPDYGAFLKGADQEMITTSADPLVLVWDLPPTPVASFGVYYRVHGTSDWTELAVISAVAQPSYPVTHAAVGAGEYDFAVVSIDATGNRSTFHSSLDASADPSTGWYVQWN